MTVERVGFAQVSEVGPLIVSDESCIVVTPDGEVRTFMADTLAKTKSKTKRNTANRKALDETADTIRTTLRRGPSVERRMIGVVVTAFEDADFDAGQATMEQVANDVANTDGIAAVYADVFGDSAP